MAHKWLAVQHPESGLIPYLFGAAPGQGTTLPPLAYTGTRDASLSAVALLQGAREFRRRPEGMRLADRLSQMASHLARGLARHAFDPDQSVFPEFLNLDGTPAATTVRYAFRTAEDRAAAARVEPACAEVNVFAGVGFYRNAPFWSHFAGTKVPFRLAWYARHTGDASVTARVAEYAEMLLGEARELRSGFTRENRWTFFASGEYIKTLLLLFETTNEPRYLDWALELADREIERLADIQFPEWWRTAERNTFLDALLRLHAAARGQFCAW